MKTTTKLAAALCLFNSANIYALGVGDIVTSTSLNQVLKAKIPLISSKGEDPTNVHINIASVDTFKKAGIDRPHYLTELKFEPVLSNNGEIVIDVSSSSNIKEPFVNFILEVEWPEGRTLKEFTILLDPPSVMPISRSPAIKHATAQETVIKPAEKKTLKKNTSADVSSNTPISDEYGPTKRRDNVWDIAKNLVKNSSDATHQQMMMALYDNNPKAFYKKNINALKRGVILQVPTSAQLQSRTTAQAKADFNDQNTLWKSSVSRKAQQTIKKSSNKSNKENKNIELVDKSNVNTQSKLSLLSLKDEQPSTSSSVENTDTAKTPENSNSPSIQASAAIEMATSLEEQNKEVKLRLSELELQVEKLQRLLVLKNEQLTQLQVPATEPVTKTPLLKETGENEISEWLQVNSTYIYSGGGLVILLLALLLARRKKDQPEDAVPAPSVNLDIDNKPDTFKEVDEPEETTLFSSTEEPLLSEFTSTEFNSAQHPQESDPLTESDVYIAYGRYQQAEDIIQNALESEPDNQTYKLKLLDVFYASSNAERFEEVAASLIILKDSDPASWANIEKMGSEINPASTLFNRPSSVDTATDINPDDFGLEVAAEDVVDVEAEPEQSTDNGIDFNLDEPELAVDHDDDSTDNDNKKDFEFDFDLIQPTPHLDESSSENLDSDDLESDDTRLSLAQAYIEMEDYISAKESLLEVLESGSTEQQQTAQEVLDKLP